MRQVTNMSNDKKKNSWKENKKLLHVQLYTCVFAFLIGKHFFSLFSHREREVAMALK